jgi:hypothetical protein
MSFPCSEQYSDNNEEDDFHYLGILHKSLEYSGGEPLASS